MVRGVQNLANDRRFVTSDSDIQEPQELGSVCRNRGLAPRTYPYWASERRRCSVGLLTVRLTGGRLPVWVVLGERGTDAREHSHGHAHARVPHRVDLHCGLRPAVGGLVRGVLLQDLGDRVRRQLRADLRAQVARQIVLEEWNARLGPLSAVGRGAGILQDSGQGLRGEGGSDPRVEVALQVVRGELDARLGTSLNVSVQVQSVTFGLEADGV
eukprot:767660-Prorocentrum_minimum.AAC.9